MSSPIQIHREIDRMAEEWLRGREPRAHRDLARSMKALDSEPYYGARPIGPRRRLAISMMRRAADCATYGAPADAIVDLLVRACDVLAAADESEGGE